MKKRAIRVALPVFLFATTACATSQAQDIPLPPPSLSALEFFEPTVTENSLRANCIGTTAAIDWHYDGSHTLVENVAFADQRLDESALGEINQYMTEIDGNVLISLRCGREGLAISLFEGDSPAASLGKKILLNVVDGRVILISRYNFD